MWGLKIYQKRPAIVKAASPIFYETQHSMTYGFDQAIINNNLTPLTVNDLVHFSFINLFVISLKL